MAQKDYVSRGRSGARRKSPSRKKRTAPAVSKTVIALAVALLVVFAGGLYFITHNKPSELPLLPGHDPRTGNGLPPKPEERWRYIKELENRQMGVSTPTEPSAGGEVKSQTQLTNEQRQLLEQMQADMRQQPTQLSEVPYNQGAQVPRSAVTMKPPVTEVQPQRATPPVQRSAPTPSVSQPSVSQSSVQSPPVTQQTAPVRAQSTAPVTPPKVEKEKTQRWMVQCGSFKAADQAESIRAQLAFEGIESRITVGGGWNRVVLGPYSTKAAADKTLQRLKAAGQPGCIPLAVGG